jgi:5'-nucleotidase/UDP-sugar diphosphatase
MKNMKWFVFLAALFLAAFSVQAEPARDTAGGAATDHELVLLHTNDHHGAVLPNGGRGGLAERASFIKAVRSINPQVLLIDAGDINTGSALSNMFDAEPDILSYNLMGYDAGTFGNHEVDASREKLLKQITQADFPFNCSNIKTPDGAFLGGHQYLVKM